MTVRVRLAVATVLLALPCAAGALDEERARERIKELQQQWVEAVAQGDVETIAGFYAKDAWFLPVGSPPLNGREDIRAWWEETLADPPWRKMTFRPLVIRFNGSGDWAYDVGASRTVVAGEDGDNVEWGKYLVVWKMVENEWKVVADAFNSN